MSEQQNLNLFQRINEIRKKVAYLKKDKTVENYKAVTHDLVVAESREWFNHFGVLVVPSLVKEAMMDTGAKSKSGNTAWRYEAVFEIVFVNVDSPEQRLSIQVPAHAIDHGDKAPGKAITYATKAALLKVLMFETGENDEARETINLQPDEQADLEEVNNLMSSIETAESMTRLLEFYTQAIAAAGKDRGLKNKIIAAKDARMAYLKALPKAQEADKKAGAQ